jgi:hypothetical protein
MIVPPQEATVLVREQAPVATLGSIVARLRRIGRAASGCLPLQAAERGTLNPI